MNKVFVYGTLMKGHGNHQAYHKDAEFLGAAVLYGYALYNNLSWFPGIIPDENERTKGEVYSVSDQVLSRLDQLEDEGSLYIRKKVRVRISEELVEVYAYIWNGSVDNRTMIAFEKLREANSSLRHCF